MARFPSLERLDLDPRVYVHLTDNWNELTLRFLAREHGVRELKNRINREILEGLTAADISIASATLELVRPATPN